MKTLITVVYELDEEDSQHLLETTKTSKVLGGCIKACCQGDAMEERDQLKLELEEALRNGK